MNYLKTTPKKIAIKNFLNFKFNTGGEIFLPLMVVIGKGLIIGFCIGAIAYAVYFLHFSNSLSLLNASLVTITSSIVVLFVIFSKNK